MGTILLHFVLARNDGNANLMGRSLLGISLNICQHLYLPLRSRGVARDIGVKPGWLFRDTDYAHVMQIFSRRLSENVVSMVFFTAKNAKNAKFKKFS